jgi:hypothetical protein
MAFFSVLSRIAGGVVSEASGSRHSGGKQPHRKEGI